MRTKSTRTRKTKRRWRLMALRLRWAFLCVNSEELKEFDRRSKRLFASIENKWVKS